jgi:D-aminoacyl-tRNA deacylase
LIEVAVIIIVSEQDQAGMNISNHLIEKLQLDIPKDVDVPPNWPKGSYKIQLNLERSIALFTMSTYHFQADYLYDYFDANLIIFASKHISKAAQKAILVHPLGNWGAAYNGSGEVETLSITPSYALTKGYFALKKYHEQAKLENYWVGVESTHHGPTQLNVPSLFIEVGGTKEEWEDQEACKAVAKAIHEIAIDYVSMEFIESVPAIIGIGGGHYGPSFLKRVEAGIFQFGHIMPKYYMASVSEDLIKQAWEKTISKEKLFLIDKKGSKGKDRQRVIEIIEKLGYPYALTTQHSVSDSNKQFGD